MTVSEYRPLYGLLFQFEYHTGIDGKGMTVNEMFENYPDFELTDIHLRQLFYFDLHSLSTVLKDKYYTPETVVPYLRELFDEFRRSGGDPLEWLHVTFEDVNLNPISYKAELRSTLEKTLIEWIEIFEKQPIDYLYYNTNPEALPPARTETEQEMTNFKNNQFYWFNRFKEEYRQYNLLQEELLYKYQRPIVDFFSKMREPDKNLSIIGNHFINEINNNIVNIQNDFSLKNYIVIIQRYLNGIYQIREENEYRAKNNPELEYLANLILHPSIPSIQNLVRDIINKNDILETITIVQQEKLVPNSLGSFLKDENDTSIFNKGECVVLSTENDFLSSSIEDELYDFRENMSEEDYQILIFVLKQYFENNHFPKIQKTITVVNTNKKAFGWALNAIYKWRKPNEKLDKEYLLFAKNNISLFKDVEFDELNMIKSNLYKYFTTKPSK